MPLPCFVDLLKMPVRIVTDVIRLDGILPLGQDKDLVERETQQFSGRYQRPFFRATADICALRELAHGCL